MEHLNTYSYHGNTSPCLDDNQFHPVGISTLSPIIMVQWKMVGELEIKLQLEIHPFFTEP